MTSDWEADRDAWGLTPEQYVRYLRRIRRHGYERLMRQEELEDREAVRFGLTCIALVVMVTATVVAWLVS